MDELESVPDYHFLPVGNAGNISAYWMGYVECEKAGIIGAKPRMVGCQAAGAAPFLVGAPIVEPETIINAPGINIKLILAGDIPTMPWRKIGIRKRIHDIPIKRMNLHAIPTLNILFWNILTSNNGD
mgnify:CR=1 FL=1